MSSWPAQIGAVVYALLPYHVFMDWFLRQAAGEFAAYAFLPLVALGVERIRRGENGRWLLSVSVAGTALSHLPTALLAAHVFAVLCVILAFQARKGHHDRLRLLGIYAWYATLGMGIACFYWIPAIALIETASADALFTHHYEAWRWLYGLTPSQPSLLAAIYITACFLTCMPILAVSLLSTRGAMLLWILIPTAVALFLNTALSELIWRHWIIAQVQFPWRLMVFVDLSTALAAAALASQVLSKTGKPAHYRLLPIAIVPYALFALNIDYSQARIPAEERYSSSTGAIEYLSPEMSESLSTRLGKVPLHDDLFLVADEIALLAAEFQAEIGMIDTVQDHPRAFQVTPAPSDSIVHLPVQYWFLWQAETSSGEALELRANLKFGTLDIVAPSGGFDGSAVLLTLPYHWSEKVGAAISLMALLMLAASLMRLRTQRPSLELASPD